MINFTPVSALIGGALIGGSAAFLLVVTDRPALTLLPLALPKAFLFVAAMLAGMVLFRFVPQDWPQYTFRGDSRPDER